MTGDTEFRTADQEVLKLLEECAELRRMLTTISSQLNRMETRVKRAFPAIAEKVRERKTQKRGITATITSDQALAEFDTIVKLAASGSTEEAERTLREKSVQDLMLIAKELGVSFAKSKPSARTICDAIFGKVRESILLSRHSPRSP